MSKYTFRVPTIQYGYVEINHEPEEEWSATKVAAMYDEYTRAFRFSAGLEKKEWCTCVDEYRRGKGMSEECHSRMNDWQRDFISELDRSNARMKPKVTKGDLQTKPFE